MVNFRKGYSWQKVKKDIVLSENKMTYFIKYLSISNTKYCPLKYLMTNYIWFFLCPAKYKWQNTQK